MPEETMKAVRRIAVLLSFACIVHAQNPYVQEGPIGAPKADSAGIAMQLPTRALPNCMASGSFSCPCPGPCKIRLYQYDLQGRRHHRRRIEVCLWQVRGQDRQNDSGVAGAVQRRIHRCFRHGRQRRHGPGVHAVRRDPRHGPNRRYRHRQGAMAA